MRYIRELIKKIPESDFSLLQAYAFSNTEKELIAHYRNDKEEDTDDFLAAKLLIKVSTLKKLQSNLLVDIINVLASEDIFDQTAYLSSVNCHKLLIHIARKKINESIKEENTELLAKIYVDIPYKLLSSVLTDYNIKELKKYKKEFQRLKPGKSYESVKLEILLYILEFMQINTLSEKYKAWLEDTIKKIDTLGNPELEFWKNKLIGDYYELIDEEKYFEIIKANMELVNQNLFDFNKPLIINSKLQYCFYLIHNNRFQETYDFYNQLEKEYPDTVGTGKSLRYNDMISQVCIVLGKYVEAREFILKGYPIEDEEPGKFAEIYFGNTTVLAMLDILEGNLEKAYKKISAAKVGLKKQYFIFLDSLLRLVEQAYYFKIKDYDFMDSLYQKNIKFYKYHDTADLEVLLSAHKIITAYAKQDFDKKQLSEKYVDFQNELNQGEFAFIGHFIKNLVK